ncbi:lig_chan-Glu_bd domain-containing protein [Nephila pilipes]|uniref:Lig_chan-Glu_bd domain-containing protein n=1 Tax=Nephila pilipes TaxID=299642 RepID=A0A8X6Q9C9_NEPPI|nr:lig_chan-Glu_bd domain-containing protein [Nephila pilipes]
MKSLYFPRKIKVASFELPSVLTIHKVDGSIVLDGVEGKVIQCLADKLNFEIEIVFSPNFQYGLQYSNGTWNGIIGMVQREEADIGVMALSISEDRWKAVNFSIPYTVLEKGFATKEPGTMPKVAAFTYPYSLNAWIFYALMTLAATVLFQRMIFKKATLLGSFLSVLGSIASQAMENVRETPWRRVLLGLWLTIATVMPFFYNTSFLSFLTMPEKMPVPRTFEELSKAVLSGKYKCLTPQATIDRELLRESGIDYMVKLGEIIEKNNWEFSFSEQFADLLDDPVAIVIPRSSLRLLLGSPPYVTVKESEDFMGIWNVGLAVRKGFCCKERLNRVLYGMLSGGLYWKWVEEHAFRDKLHKRWEVKHEKPELQLTLKDLKMAFFALFIGYGLAFLSFLTELLIPKHLDIFIF